MPTSTWSSGIVEWASGGRGFYNAGIRCYQRGARFDTGRENSCQDRPRSDRGICACYRGGCDCDLHGMCSYSPSWHLVSAGWPCDHAGASSDHMNKACDHTRRALDHDRMPSYPADLQSDSMGKSPGLLKDGLEQ